MKFTVEIIKDQSQQWRWRLYQRGKRLAESRGYPRVGPVLKNLEIVLGIRVRRHLRVYEAPFKEEGAYMIWGRIQPPIRFPVDTRWT